MLGKRPPAESTLINQDVLVTFNEAGVFTKDAVNVGAGPEITPFDGTNIGNGILFPNEFIDIGEARIVFQIEGLGVPNGALNHSIPHYQSDAQFSFTNLLWGGTPGKIMEVDIILDNVFGVAFNPEVFFTKNSLDLKVGTLSIGFNDNLQSFVGQITLNLIVEHENSNPIPESSTFFLFCRFMDCRNGHMKSNL